MDFEDVFVSHHQMVVASDEWNGVGLGIYVVGGRLFQPTGPSAATVFTGPHTGTVRVRAAGLTDPPDEAATGWDAVEEVTLWAPDGRITVNGLMGEPLPSAPDLAVAGPGCTGYRFEHAVGMRTTCTAPMLSRNSSRS